MLLPPDQRELVRDEALFDIVKYCSLDTITEFLTPDNVRYQNLNRNTALMYACMNSRHPNLDLIRTVVEMVPEAERTEYINIRDVQNDSAIMYACGCDAEYTHMDTVLYLADHGADFTGTGDQDNTPLHYAVLLGGGEEINFLIEEGADMDAKNIYGETALDLALKKGSRSVIDILQTKANLESTP